MTWLWVALGSAAGGTGRYWCMLWIDTRIDDAFPWGTLAVNVIGSALIGLVATLGAPDARWFIPSEGRQFLMLGVLGGFTTFSSFSLQSLSLLQDGRWLPAGIYVAGSVLVCLFGVWAGYSIGSALVR